ncbi:MAG: hypothetical protein AAF483_05355 [Planctomycetota bacterium]
MDHHDEKSNLMESLLHHALGESSNENDARVDQVMAKIRTEEQIIDSVNRPSGTTVPRRAGWPWIAIAAGLLIALGFLPWSGTDDTAVAALSKMQMAESLPMIREYTVQLETRDAAGVIHRRVLTLYVRNREFAIRTPALFGPDEVWLGGNGDQRWIVPSRGPVMVGQAELFQRWERRREFLEVPFYSMAVLLEQMARAYELEFLSDPDASSEVLHVVATKKKNRKSLLPDNIECWSNSEHQFVHQLEGIWNRANSKQGWLTINFEFKGFPGVSESIFDHSHHHDSVRTVVDRRNSK